LKQRGLFDDTLIVFSGEFGRTPMAQGNKGPIGRDHHNKAMSMWLAGAGIQRGLTYGATDDLGYAARKTSPPSTTSTPRCSINSASSTTPSASSSKGLMQG
jgi:uncharacterized protein (DUF1501 family)